MYGKRKRIWVDFRKEINWRKVLFVSCECECGTKRDVRKQSLKSWSSKSCGCIKNNNIKEIWKKNKTHWMTWTKFYNTWARVNCRCNYKWNKDYKHYWGRWIVVLRKSFEEFKCDMYDSYLKHLEIHWEKNTTIDRIDNDWNYCKENCRWATIAENNRNKRFKTREISFWGKTQSIKEWTKELGFGRSTLHYRLNVRWWTVETAITTPYNKRKKYFNS